MSWSRWLYPLTRWLRPAPTAAEGATPARAATTAADSTLQRSPDSRSPDSRSADPLPAVATPPADTPADTPIPETSGDERRRFIGWLLGRPDDVAHPEAAPRPGPGVRRMFERLDQVIASDALRANLLPRAPHVVPQLMKTLRDEGYSSADVAQRISKDVVLTAEVIRNATSAFQRSDDGEIDLARAVAVIGTQGLRRAIASVVLRPIFDARGDTLSARAAAQIWKDADHKARLCAALAAHHALDPFDGYLAGLLHNTGWSAALRAIDGFQDAPVGAAELAHPEVAPELLKRRDALFGALVQPWHLSPGLDQLAAEIGSGGLAAAQSPLGSALRSADRLALLRALAPAGGAAAAGVPEWATLPKPVQECYAALGPG